MDYIVGTYDMYSTRVLGCYYPQLFLSDKPLQETDEIINSVCALATYYERRGFTEGVKTGIRLGIEEGVFE